MSDQLRKPVYPTSAEAFAGGTRFALDTDVGIGEWAQRVRQRFPSPDDGTYALGMLRTEVRNVLQAFPWATPTSASVSVLPDLRDRWEPAREPIGDWLAALGPDSALTGGLRMVLDLSLVWQTRDGTLGPVTLAAGADFSIDTLQNGTLHPWITIWPNVFTNRIGWVDTALVQPWRADAPNDEQVYFVIPCANAAQHNRGLLRAALTRWEEFSGGTINEWDSEFVPEDGIGRYGIRDDAVLDAYWLDD